MFLRTKSEFTEDRDIDLLHVFNDVVRNYNIRSQCEALRIALDKPSKTILCYARSASAKPSPGYVVVMNCKK